MKRQASKLIEEKVIVEEVTKADKLKLLNEYMTTYRTILTMQHGTASTPDMDYIHTKAMSMVDEIFYKSLEVAGLDNIQL